MPTLILHAFIIETTLLTITGFPHMLEHERQFGKITTLPSRQLVQVVILVI